MTFGCSDGASELRVWEEIHRRAPSWFLTCLSCTDKLSFVKWLHAMQVSWYRNGDVIVFCVPQRQSHVVEVHLAILSPLYLVRREMEELLEWLFALSWKRIVVPVTSNAGRGIRKALREMGFEKEGTLRAAQRGFNTRSATEEYLDVDVWAILKEGDRNGL